MNRLLVIQIAALGYEFLRQVEPSMTVAGLRFRPMQTVFPAVTCTVQASFRTAAYACSHGMVANGIFLRELHKPLFWEQSSGLYAGARIWERFRSRGQTVGQLFWQQSLGPDSDLVLSPAPIHKHGGGMIQDCFSRPPELQPYLLEHIGRDFNLMHYWGPLTSVKSSRWITEATTVVMQSKWAPDLLLTYLPHLDYELQKSGPYTERGRTAYNELKGLLETLAGSARQNGYDVLAFGDYAMQPVDRAIMPNQLLSEHGLLRLREVRGMLYPDLHTSSAFAMVDHQIAHIICADEKTAETVGALFEGVAGVAEILDSDRAKRYQINHGRSGDRILIAAPNTWFAYPWWHDLRQAPDYAEHVDIHNKPGYDPCELFFGRWFNTSVEPARIKGSHGMITDEPQVVYATDLDLDTEPGSLVELAATVKTLLDEC